MMQPLPAPTDLTLPVDPTVHQRSARTTTILMVARLITATGDHICRARNISAGGVMLECHADLRVDEPVRVALHELDIVGARIAWVRSPLAGLTFAVPIDVDDVLHPRTVRRGQTPRAPRFTASGTVRLSLDGHCTEHALRNLSQAGCGIAIETPPAIGSLVRITLPGLPTRSAAVRWARDGAAGLAYCEIMSFLELASWQCDHAHGFASGLGTVARPSATQ